MFVGIAPRQLNKFEIDNRSLGTQVGSVNVAYICPMLLTSGGKICQLGTCLDATDATFDLCSEHASMLLSAKITMHGGRYDCNLRNASNLSLLAACLDQSAQSG